VIYNWYFIPNCFNQAFWDSSHPKVIQFENYKNKIRRQYIMTNLDDHRFSATSTTSPYIVFELDRSLSQVESRKNHQSRLEIPLMLVSALLLLLLYYWFLFLYPVTIVDLLSFSPCLYYYPVCLKKNQELSRLRRSKLRRT